MNNKKIFNKLVRDKIPDIIRNNGEIAEIEILNDITFLKMLDEKLLEECNEVLTASDPKSKIEEIADIFEVLYAMIDSLGISKEDVENIRLDKQVRRGGFKEKIFLKSTFNKDDIND